MKMHKKTQQLFRSKICILFWFFCFFPSVLFAQEIHSVKGVAQLTLDSKRRSFSLDSVIEAQCGGEMKFIVLDDFANAVFQASFKPSQKVELLGKTRFSRVAEKKLMQVLKLPFNTSQLNQLLCNQDLPVSKKYQTEFSDFKKIGKMDYPHRIQVLSKKSKFTIQWRKVLLK